MGESWTIDHRRRAVEHIVNLWPQSKGFIGKQLALWELELANLGLGDVLDAMDHIKRTQESSKTPTIAQVKKIAQELEIRRRGKPRSVRREVLIARLRILEKEGARWINPKNGKGYYVGPECFWRLGEGAIPIGDIPTEDLERVLGNNERDINRSQPVEVARERRDIDG